MTEDVVNVNVNEKDSTEEEKRGLDMSGHEGPPTPAVPLADCNGVKDESKTGKGNSEDDPDASYVFIGGIDDPVSAKHSHSADLYANSQVAQTTCSTLKDSDNVVDRLDFVHQGDAVDVVEAPSADPQVPNGNLVIEFEAHEKDDQQSVEEDLAGDAQGTPEFHSETIEPETALLQANGTDAKAESEHVMESVPTQNSSNIDVAESELNRSSNIEVTSSTNIDESKSNQSSKREVIEDPSFCESEASQSGLVEVTSSMNIVESELDQCGDNEAVDNASLADTEPNQSGNIEVADSANTTESKQTQSSVEEEIQEESTLGSDQGKDLVQLANNLPVDCLQTASELDQNTEVKMEGAEAVDASSSSEYTNGLSSSQAPGCDAEKDPVNGLACEANGCSDDVETSLYSYAEIIDNGTSTVSDAETGKGFGAAINNCAIGDPTNDVKAPVIQFNLDAEKIRTQTVSDDSVHDSQIAPQDNRISGIIKDDLFENGATESYKSDPTGPASDPTAGSAVEIGSPSPVNSMEIHDGMKTLDENLDGDSSESLSSHLVNDREVVIEPDCHPLPNEKASSTPDMDASLETETDCTATISEEEVSASSKDEVCLQAEASAGAADVLDGSVVTSQSNSNLIRADVKSIANDLVIIDSDKKTPQEMDVNESLNKEEASISSPEGSIVDASDGQNSLVDVVTRPFYYMIRIPRYDDDDNLKEQIKRAQIQVDEKTKSRDAIRAEIQKERANSYKFTASIDAALSEETAARDLLKAKRKEIDSVLVVINRGKSASELKNIDDTIHAIEYKIQHETLPLKEEKQYIIEIKKLKQTRERLSDNFGSQEAVQEAIDQKVQFEERMKILRKEADLLRESALKAEAATKNDEKKYQGEKAKVDVLAAQFRAADDIRQEAYAHLQSLRKRLYDKSKYFYKYKDDATAASDLASKGKKEELQHHCVNQVERFMELWNGNDEFRKEYERCNRRSTLRRFRTLDGRSLGPDEDPPVIPNFVNERLAENNVIPSISALQEEKITAPVKNENKDAISVSKVRGQNDAAVKSEKPVKHATLGKGLATVSGRVEVEKADTEEHKLTKEEEELARKAEDVRKKEEAAMLREQRLLDEKIKAKEAMERKKRNADKARARAELKARKEAEQKEKEKEKKARKKEKKKGLEEVNGSIEGEAAPNSETPAETKESETIEKPVAVTKRSQKQLHFAKQTKAKSMPLPLRNRNKRRMQTWMWVLLFALVIVAALFLLGNGSTYLRSLGFGF
ncbi:uncharacterized protein LOC126684035 [Mercurialis annua]|uniref:uncharacterized protein LOC126684035 n=1 Tax=Mercurialis annua TaxID=3986 RepID=UPI00215F675E|nr:uncharacterized protein LOC126684035 [Mercurialis annua]